MMVVSTRSMVGLRSRYLGYDGDNKMRIGNMINRGYARYSFYGGLLAVVLTARSVYDGGMNANDGLRTIEIMWYQVYGRGHRRYIGHWNKAYSYHGYGRPQEE